MPMSATFTDRVAEGIRWLSYLIFKDNNDCPGKRSLWMTSEHQLVRLPMAQYHEDGNHGQEQRAGDLPSAQENGCDP